MAKKILVIEDDQVAREILARWLRESGYETAFGFDAISAVGIARKEQPDLIVLDIGLPGGDGFVVMERLKALPSLAQIPVIVFTVQDTETNRERARAAGAQVFLDKASGHDELLAAIRTQVGK